MPILSIDNMVQTLPERRVLRILPSKKKYITNIVLFAKTADRRSKDKGKAILLNTTNHILAGAAAVIL